MSSPAPSPAALLAALEDVSRGRADRVLRLRGTLPGDSGALEPFELLIFRGFSSSTTHPTAVDPDQPVLTSRVLIESAELLAAPLNPAEERVLAGPLAPERFLQPDAWL